MIARSPRRALVVLCSGALVALAGCSSSRVPLPAVSATPASPVPAVGARTITGPVDPEDTGVSEDLVLVPSEGLRITEDGTVVDGLDIDGCVDVLANDVTIRNTRIRCGDDRVKLVVRIGGDNTGLLIEDSEIDGRGELEVGVGWGHYTLRRVDIHDVVDGAHFGDDSVIEECWIHDMARIRPLHPDALQTTSASHAVVRGNVLDPARTSNGDHNNAGLMMGSELGDRLVDDVLVEHNLFDGGNYSLNIRGDVNARNVTIRDNVFGGGARYGAVLAPSSVPLGEGNVMAGSGRSVEADPASGQPSS